MRVAGAARRVEGSGSELSHKETLLIDIHLSEAAPGITQLKDWQAVKGAAAKISKQKLATNQNGCASRH